MATANKRDSQPLCIFPALFGYPAELATLIVSTDFTPTDSHYNALGLGVSGYTILVRLAPPAPAGSGRGTGHKGKRFLPNPNADVSAVVREVGGGEGHALLALA